MWLSLNVSKRTQRGEGGPQNKACPVAISFMQECHGRKNVFEGDVGCGSGMTPCLNTFAEMDSAMRMSSAKGVEMFDPVCAYYSVKVTVVWISRGCCVEDYLIWKLPSEHNWEY